MRSTGAGGTFQLWTFSEKLLVSAWTQARLNWEQPDVDAIATILNKLIEIVRAAARGDACQVRVLVAFTGPVFVEAGAISLPFGTVRAITDRERRLAPASLEGSISTTNPDGETLVAFDSGDVVLDTTVEYRIKVARFDPEPGVIPSWPSDFRGFELIGERADTVRLVS